MTDINWEYLTEKLRDEAALRGNADAGEPEGAAPAPLEGFSA